MSRLGFSDQAYASLKQMGLVPLFEPHYVAPAPETAAPQSLTNVQKLSLPANTTVGTRVAVSDGFVVSESEATGFDGFWWQDGTNGGKPTYRSLTTVGNSSDTGVAWDGTQWVFDAADQNITATGATDYPWQAAWPTETLTHPAVQTLAAPSSAQGGVAVLGGTQDGVYAKRGTNEGKDYFAPLGVDPDPSISSLAWWSNISDQFVSGPSSAGFAIVDVSQTVLYYSLSDVATPDLASNWKNASDDSPASITVTSVSVGEIYAGLYDSNDGPTSGSSYVSQPFHGRQYYMGLNGGGSNNMHWDTDFNVWTDDVGVWTTDNVAFPWQGADNGGGHTGATFARNDVANEANWEVVP